MSHRKLAVIPAVLALATAPALALASPPASTPSGKTPGPHASLPAKAKAYGKYCQAESKKHVAGQKGTPFSQCVTAMAKLAHNDKMSAKQACKTESKKHVAGQKGTPYSQCISAAAKLKADQSDSGDTTSTTGS